MEKDVVYSMRMSSTVREALKRAARRDRRSVSSLLDKIITDYLFKEGFLEGGEFGGDRRRSPRHKIPLPAKILLKEGSEVHSYPGVINDISLGGVMVIYPKRGGIRFPSTGKLPEFELCFELPRAEEQVCFECDARHMHETGNEIQVGAAFRHPNQQDLQSLEDYVM